ncbi:MAG: histidinol dehydrogenase [Chloroflexi bacterium HGW-Chloroflexi-10]|nr:MAG: histidinol dehydrogenase [Chloroflexi bacterium HGW-Chloroflexi-10]
MFSINSVDEAKQTILRRRAIDDYEIPSALSASMLRFFGEELTPEQGVARILKEIRTQGDVALHKWTQILDGSTQTSFRVPIETIQSAPHQITPEQKAALEVSISRVRAFHQHQPLSSWINNDLGGILGQMVRPIRRVGLYIPAGTAPLPSSVIMSAVPAQVAGVSQIVLVAPPDRKTGQISSLILAAAALLGLEEVYAVGGAQAIGALAYGTESIPPVDKIFGPGNLFVTLAKKQVYGSVGIDNLAGPTETMVIADEFANPAWVASDLLAQAEHDLLASAILLTPSQSMAMAVAAEIQKQLDQRSRVETIRTSLQNRGGAVITRDLDEAIALANNYGAEHLCLAVRDPWTWVEKITCAGGIFIGEHSFEVLGDYVAGPSHVMPTSGSARFASPLNVWDFIKLISLIGLDEKTVSQIAPTAIIIANAEGLDAHASAAEMRL